MAETPPPPYDPSKVQVNGHAIGLITSLFENLQHQVDGVETQLREDLARRFEEHDKQHATAERQAADFRRDVRRDLGAVTLWQRNAEQNEAREDQAAAVERRIEIARREGQMWVPMKVAALAERYPKLAQALGLAAGGGLVAIVTRLLGGIGS